MKKEKINLMKLRENKTIWRFSYFEDSSNDLIEQYRSEFRNVLEEKGILSQKNLIANTNNYRDEILMYDRGELAISGSRKFMNVYYWEGSNLVEEGEYKNAFEVEEKLTKGNELEVTLHLETPKKMFFNLKHKHLENELTKILKR